MKLFFLLTALLAVGCSAIHSQTVDMRSMDFYRSRIVNMDKFFERFNGRDVPTGIKSSGPNLRPALLLSLFEYDTAYTYQEEVISFISDIITDSVYLVFETTDWEAVAECEASIDNNDVGTVTLRLRVEIDSAKRFLKWAIMSVEGSPLKLIPDIRASVFSMSPVAHELNFQELRKITTNYGTNILNYAFASYRPDMTTVFYQMVMSGRLKLGSVLHLKYLFNVDGWHFEVEFYERETENSGWLINHLVKSNTDIE